MVKKGGVLTVVHSVGLPGSASYQSLRCHTHNSGLLTLNAPELSLLKMIFGNQHTEFPLVGKVLRL